MLLFAAFTLAFMIKVPMVPLHTWLPDAHTEAPTGGSVDLAGVLLKMGAYGFLRFSLPMFPHAAEQAFPVIMTLAVVGIIYGAMVAFLQPDMKRLVAYSSVSHLGFIMLGLYAFNNLGVTGGVLQMVNHGLSTGALFILVGYIYDRRHTRLISEYGGLWSIMPVYAAFFLCRDAVVDRPAGHQRLRRRVPHPARRLPRPSLGGRHRHARRRARRGVHADDVQGRVLRAGHQRGQQPLEGSLGARGPGGRADHRR